MANLSQILARPIRSPGLDCEKYSPGVSRRCAYYLDNGACTRHDRFMCSEWLRVNASVPSTEAVLVELHKLRDHLAVQIAGGQ